MLTIMAKANLLGFEGVLQVAQALEENDSLTTLHLTVCDGQGEGGAPGADQPLPRKTKMTPSLATTHRND